MALTRRQKELMDFLAEFITKNGYSPSYEEIANGLKLASLATVHKHIQALQAKNYLRRSFNHSRSLEIGERYFAEEKARRPSADLAVPLLGRIAAGTPVEAIQNAESLHFSDFARNDSTFALQVRGDSMIEDHICSGDYVLVEKTDQVKNGEIVVALVDGSDATLKRYYREPDGGQIRLQPANSTMHPIFVDPSQLQIQGKVLAVMRKY
jgi:repressor LexA